MIDLGLSKLALIGVVALVVIGPEKLPRVARTVGALLGKAQRYVNDVKAEVNRSMAMEELRKAQEEVSAGVRDIHNTFQTTAQQMRESVDGADEANRDAAGYGEIPVYQQPHKKWRTRRTATPVWYKARAGVRRYAQSGAARVARHRPGHY